MKGVVRTGTWPRRAWLCLLVAGIGAGCASSRTPTSASAPVLALPRARTTADPAKRVRVPPSGLTLHHALAMALANNPDIVAGGFDVDAAQARTRGASADRWPTLDVMAAYRHHWHQERLAPARGKPGEGATSHDIFYGDVVLSVPLIEGGRTSSTIAASELLARAAERRLARTKEELVFHVKQVFFLVLGQRRQIEATQSARGMLREQLRTTQALIDNRKAAEVERYHLEVRLAELDHLLVQQKGDKALQERLLASLLGIEALPPSGLNVQGDLHLPRGYPTPDQALSNALASRPDLKEALLEIEAQSERIEAAEASYWPVVSAKGTYGARMSVEQDYDDLGFAGVEMALPVFSGFSTSARVDEERAKLHALEQKKRKLGLRIRREIETAAIRIQTARAQIDSTEKAISVAKKSLRIARDNASLGRGTIMDVLDAQTALLRAETQHFSALVDLHTAVALLELSAGTSS